MANVKSQWATQQQLHVTLQQNLKNELSDKSSQAGSLKPNVNELRRNLRPQRENPKWSKYTPAYVNGLLSSIKKLECDVRFPKGETDYIESRKSHYEECIKNLQRENFDLKRELKDQKPLV